MPLNWRLVWVYLVILFTFAPSLAQTIDNLQKKYGSPDHKGRYVARPGVVVYTAPGKVGDARKIVVEAQSVSTLDRAKPMSPDTVNEILGEIVPVSQRGKLIRSLSLSGGCTSKSAEEYERISITRLITCASGGGVTSAEIQWKVRKRR